MHVLHRKEFHSKYRTLHITPAPNSTTTLKTECKLLVGGIKILENCAIAAFCVTPVHLAANTTGWTRHAQKPTCIICLYSLWSKLGLQIL
jgi:hypothetical protein